MLNIYQASAGSGKTFNLALEYFKLIFKDPETFRHTLAVTFTNKATEEMKRRIIEELYILSSRACESPYLKELLSVKDKIGILSETDLQEKAKSLLSMILHDYSHFSVSTIDQFFQHLIRSFLRELNQSPTYSVELNEDLVISRSVDNVIHQLNTDPALKSWIEQYIDCNIEDGAAWNIVKALESLGKEILQEKVSALSSELRSYGFSDLASFRSENYAFVKNYRKEQKHLAKCITDIIDRSDYEDKDFKQGNRGPAGTFRKIASGAMVISALSELNSYTRHAADNPDEWFGPKKISKQDAASLSLQLAPATADFIMYVEKNGKSYNTALASMSNIYQLGVLKAISEEISRCCKEDNVMLIYETMVLLNKLISHNDSSFIYEKSGTRYNNIMIDEFQDTSVMQWQNFYPLLLNTVASGNYAMLVGDIKQSIYKFRNGDWRLLASGVKRDFIRHEIQEHHSLYNWRSAANIVAFNNFFFQKAIGKVKEYFNDLVGEELENIWDDTITDAYMNSAQTAMKRGREGCVEVLFSPYGNNKEVIEEEVFGNVLNVLHQLHETGIHYGDCAVLVNTGSEGESVARILLENGIPFVSNDSLCVSTSPSVRFIITVLRYLVDPGNLPNKALLMSLHCGIMKKPLSEDNFFKCTKNAGIKELTGVDIDEKELFTRPLFDIVERLISLFGLGNNRKEVPYLMKLQNEVYLFCSSNPDSVADFIEAWDLTISASKLTLSENLDAVKIMTIHKSKGLEFKHVILPFFNWTFYKNTGVIWVSPNNGAGEVRHIPVPFSPMLLDSDYNRDYAQELFMAMVDRLNVIYVAMTRAVYSMHICAMGVSENSRSVSSNNLLHDLLEQADRVEWSVEEEGYYRLGEYENPAPAEDEDPEGLLSFDRYVSEDASLRFKTKSSREEFGIEDEHKLAIDKGKMLHRVMQNVQTPADIERAVHIANEYGLFPSAEIPYYIHMVESFIAASPNPLWFSEKVTVVNERTIILPDGKQYRPDRVVISEDQIYVIDYKFGEEHESYLPQVKKYCTLLKNMGYVQQIRGIVWYPIDGIVETVPF